MRNKIEIPRAISGDYVQKDIPYVPLNYWKVKPQGNFGTWYIRFNKKIIWLHIFGSYFKNFPEGMVSSNQRMIVLYY